MAEGMPNGIIRTDKWMDEQFQDPVQLCALASPDIENHAHYYRYLQKFGMYQPSKRTHDIFTKLKEQQAWEHIREIYMKYKKLWNAPDVDVYIFPVQPSRTFMADLKGRSGVTFPGQIFLFLSNLSDLKLWESLFIHEFHHAVRMARFKKDPEDYHLLDSLAFEGLAEHAVLKYCGKDYSAEWMRRYQRKQLLHYWNRIYKRQLELKKNDPLHDDLLFGRKGIPHMMGYAMGADIVTGYENEDEPLSVQRSFDIPSETLISHHNVVYQLDEASG